MKKTIVLMLVVVSLMTANAMAIVVPDGDFEQATTVGDNDWAYVDDLYAAGETPWIVSFLSGGGTPWLGNNYPYGGNYPGVGHSGTQWIEGNYAIISQLLTDTYVGGITYRLSAWIWPNDTGELLEFYFGTDTTDGYNGGTTTLAASYYPDHTLKTWQQYGGEYTATPADAGKQIGIAILADSWIYLDDVTLEKLVVVKAWGPDPYDGETGVLLDKTLSWNTGVDPNTGEPNPAITEHKVYMNDGTDDPNLFYVTTIAASGDTGQYTPGGAWLERAGTYLWRIDEVEPNALGPGNIIHTGDVWAFETVLSIPDIDPATPADVMVDPNGTAIFTVSATNPFTGDSSDLSYQWYKVGTPDTAIGTNSPTLTINNVQPANEGEYYCTVTIGSNSSTDNSRSAGLGVKRLLGHWKLDETTGTTAADSSGNSNTGTVNGAGASPAWTTGIIEGALSFDGADYGVVGSLLTDYVDCGSEPNLLQPAMQVTVSGWYNTDTYTYYGQIAGFAYDSGSDESGYAIVTEEGGWIGFWIAAGNGDGDYLWTSDVPAAPTGWTHVAGTYDGTTRRLYINGAEKATSTGQSGNIDYDHVNRFMIGLNESGGWWLPYQGDIDDVKVYNYALDPVAVAHEYTAGSGETVCLESLPLDITGPDGEPDCRINLWDFQGMAASWLECNIIPVENCPLGGV